MSSLAIFNQNLPTYLANTQDTLAQTMAHGFSSGQYNRISLKGGRFHLIENGTVVTTSRAAFIDVVIVDAQPNNGRIYFDKQYSADEKIKPACWSSNGVTPDAPIATRPTIKIHDATPRAVNSCAECPKNIKGSGQNGGRACGFTRRIAVVPASDVSGTVYTMDIKAMSLFKDDDPQNNLYSFGGYARFLTTPRNGLPHGISPSAIVTRISFDDTESVPVVRFGVTPNDGTGVGGYLSAEDYATVLERRKSDAVVNMMKASVAEVLDADTDKTAKTTSEASTAPQLPTPPAPPAIPASEIAAPPAPQKVKRIVKQKKIVEEPALMENHPSVPAEWKAWATTPGVTREQVIEQFTQHFPEAVKPVQREIEVEVEVEDEVSVAPPAAPSVPMPPAPPTPPVAPTPAKRTRKKKEDTVGAAPVAPTPSVDAPTTGGSSAMAAALNTINSMGLDDYDD
ncbi:hypothetical protein V757_02255 [Pelistega indica]|uniref:Uncharacterized protein n=1 Tax=Pelistega indica TaxID=1414851 RepID=V8GAP0_9BURK|nr:hypothetical protein [Pelistega indica]ETD72782.1 hypothetical protein V757_02255 [Pelistega indica]